MGKAQVQATRLIRFIGGAEEFHEDLLAVEEPLEIRLGFGAADKRQQQKISVTMRTPGNDFELALGFLFTEGILETAGDIQSIQYCTELNSIENQFNIVRVELKENVPFHGESIQRNFYTSSSCGVCGKASIDAVFQHCDKVLSSDFRLNAKTLLGLPQTLKEHQQVFTYTGGLHGCALFSADGNLLMSREDVGRHNALDKLIGALIGSNRNAFAESVLMLSGRASFELLQKAAMAGIPVVAAVGAPSSLAVEIAREAGITLIGFLRDERFNIYCGEQRIRMQQD